MEPGTKVRIITFHPIDSRAKPPSELVGKIVITLEGFKKNTKNPGKGWYKGATTRSGGNGYAYHKAVWIEKVEA